MDHSAGSSEVKRVMISEGGRKGGRDVKMLCYLALKMEGQPQAKKCR